MKGEELALFITAAALISAKSLKTEDLELLSVVFTQLADTYATIALARSRDEDGTLPEISSL